MKDDSIKEHKLASVLFGQGPGVPPLFLKTCCNNHKYFPKESSIYKSHLQFYDYLPSDYTYFSVNLVLQVEHAKQFTHHALFKAETTTKEKRKDKMNPKSTTKLTAFIIIHS